MASNSSLVCLSDCADILTGFPFSSANYADQGYRLLRGDNIVQGSLRWDGVKFLPLALPVQPQYRLLEDDVVLAMDRPWIEAGLKCARIGPRDSGCLLVQRVARMRANHRTHPGYLYAVIRSRDFTEYILGVQTGTGVPHISKNQIGAFRLHLPQLSEQEAIGELMRSIDDRIAILKDVSETLEGLSQAIFKSWFVDFDPVRAKEEGREPEGMDACTAALFPSEFVESELGPLPTGWNVSGLGALVELAYGKALKAENRVAGKIPVMGSNGRIGWNDAALVKGPGIVVGRKGNPGVITWVNSDFFPIDTTFYVKPTEHARGMHTLRYQLSMLNLASLGADSAVPGLNREMAYLTKVPNPPKRIADQFESLVSPMIEKMAHNEEQVQSMSDLRDTLLPRLISGKLRVPDAEKIVEARL